MQFVIFSYLLSVVCVTVAIEAYRPNKTPLISSRPEGNLRKYEPTWTDLDTRPLPEWYDRAKVGIFIHWGVFSVPSFGDERFWTDWHSGNQNIINFMEKNYPPNFTYQDFGAMFTAEFFEPSEWAELFLKSGAKYIVLTSKHHEGYTLFPSKRSFSWNSVYVGAHRDIVGELATAVRDKGLKFGLYHSLFEWFNPMYLEDKDNLFLTKTYPATKLWPDLKQLVNDYKPSVIWSDGDWVAFDAYWNSTDFIAWLYNDSPVKDEIVVNDRWGIGIPCHHGDFFNCEDRYSPGVLQKHKWENAFTIDKKSWGYRRNINLKEIMSFDEILREMASTVSCGGNVLINIGPTKEGSIQPIFQERLLSLGQWLSINGEAIYETSPWLHQNDTANGDVWYTCKKAGFNGQKPTAAPMRADKLSAVYAIVLKWPKANLLVLHDVAARLQSGTMRVQLLGNAGYLNWKIHKGIANIVLPDKSTVNSTNAWTLKFTFITKLQITKINKL